MSQNTKEHRKNIYISIYLYCIKNKGTCSTNILGTLIFHVNNAIKFTGTVIDTKRSTYQLQHEGRDTLSNTRENAVVSSRF